MKEPLDNFNDLHICNCVYKEYLQHRVFHTRGGSRRGKREPWPLAFASDYDIIDLTCAHNYI